MKVNLILDLDQTLISAEAEEDYDFKKHKEKAKNFDFEDMEGYYIVFERPGLQKFLDYIFNDPVFNVSVWTAASKDYALFIINKFILTKPGRKLDYVFFSYHCDLSDKEKKASKALSMFWDKYGLPGYNADNTIILDDYDEVYNTQKHNCLIAKGFEFTNEGSENDTFLTDIIPKLEKMKEKVLAGEKNPADVVNA